MQTNTQRFLSQLNDPLAQFRKATGSSKEHYIDCPICGLRHGVHVGDPIAWCKNEDSKRIKGDGGSWHRTNEVPGLGMGYLWADEEPEVQTESERKIWEERRAIAATQQALRDQEAARKAAEKLANMKTDEGRDEAYRLAWQPLNRADRKNLEGRLGQLEDAKAIVAGLEKLKIVGHYGQGLSLAMLISNYVGGLLLGGQVRFATGNSKYVWDNKTAGSTERKNGLKPIGSWEHLHPENPVAILVVEGFLKALIAQLLCNAAGRRWIVIGQGGNNFGSAAETEAAIAQYKAQYDCPCYLVPDSDWVVNPAVEKAVVNGLKSGRYDGVIMLPYKKDGKDKAIDDLTLEALKALKPVSIEDALIMMGAMDAVEKVHYYDASNPQSVREAMEPIPGMLTVDISGTGEGKSYRAAQVIGDRTQEGLKSRYVSSDYRNPSDPRLAEMTPVQGRHSGLTERNGKTVIAAPGEPVLVQSNCFKSEKINRLVSSGALGEESVFNEVCRNCPLFRKCLSGNGVDTANGYGEKEARGYGFLSGLKGMKGNHRLSPLMLKADHDEDWADGKHATFIDEMGTIKARLTTVITMDEAAAFRAQSRLGDELPKWKPLFDALNNSTGYGLLSAEAMEAIAHITIEDCDIAAKLTAPDFTVEGVAIEDLDPETQRRFKGQRSEHLIANAIPSFAQCVKSIIQGKGSMSISGKRINFRLNTDFAQSLLLRGATLLTATPDMGLLRTHFGDNIRIVSSAPKVKADNLTVIKIDGLGRCGINRSEYTQRTIPQIISSIEALNRGTVGVLDHKKYLHKISEDIVKGTKFGDSIGSNTFVNADVTDLVIIGSFNPSVSAVELEYAAAVAAGLKMDFNAFYRQIQNTNMEQAIGRLRANRRPGQKLTVWVLDSTFQGHDEVFRVEQLLGDKATGKHGMIVRVANALKTLPEGSFRAIAKLAGCTGATVSRVYELACAFLEFGGVGAVLDQLQAQWEAGEISEEELDEATIAMVQEWAVEAPPEVPDEPEVTIVAEYFFEYVPQ